VRRRDRPPCVLGLRRTGPGGTPSCIRGNGSASLDHDLPSDLGSTPLRKRDVHVRGQIPDSRRSSFVQESDRVDLGRRGMEEGSVSGSMAQDTVLRGNVGLWGSDTRVHDCSNSLGLVHHSVAPGTDNVVKHKAPVDDNRIRGVAGEAILAEHIQGGKIDASGESTPQLGDEDDTTVD
jgi:hypothetical protein